MSVGGCLGICVGMWVQEYVNRWVGGWFTVSMHVGGWVFNQVV